MENNVGSLMLMIVGQIPVGCVATYGQIARLAGKPNNARQVGSVLRGLPAKTDVPWHRVVNARGQISRQGSDCANIQSNRLANEGVTIDDGGRIDMAVFQWEK